MLCATSIGPLCSLSPVGHVAYTPGLPVCWPPTMLPAHPDVPPPTPPHALTCPCPPLPCFRYTLTLPSGSRYSALSGPVQGSQSVSLGGLRLFALPLTSFQVHDTPNANTYEQTIP